MPQQMDVSKGGRTSPDEDQLVQLETLGDHTIQAGLDRLHLRRSHVRD